jgi:hypothetical protein
MVNVPCENWSIDLRKIAKRTATVNPVVVVGDINSTCTSDIKYLYNLNLQRRTRLTLEVASPLQIVAARSCGLQYTKR